MFETKSLRLCSVFHTAAEIFVYSKPAGRESRDEEHPVSSAGAEEPIPSSPMDSASTTPLPPRPFVLRPASGDPRLKSSVA